MSGVPLQFRPVIGVYASIENVKREIYGRHADWPCGQGCSGCCHFSNFLVSRSEWELMRLGLFELPELELVRIKEEARYWIKERFHDVDQYGWERLVEERAALTLKCPLLDEQGGCSIYDVRPSICRLYGYACRPGAEGMLYGCPLIVKYVTNPDNDVKQLPSVDPVLREIDQNTWGDSRPIVGWLADDDEFRIARSPRSPRPEEPGAGHRARQRPKPGGGPRRAAEQQRLAQEPSLVGAR